MAIKDPRAAPAAAYLLVRTPPVRSGRGVIGGWGLEAWRGRDHDWVIDLAGFGAYYWVDSDLAQIVATRSLRAHSVTVRSWRPCGSDAPMFLARIGAIERDAVGYRR